MSAVLHPLTGMLKTTLCFVTRNSTLIVVRVGVRVGARGRGRGRARVRARVLGFAVAEADVQVLGAAHRDELLVRELGVSLVEGLGWG